MCVYIHEKGFVMTTQVTENVIAYTENCGSQECSDETGPRRQVTLSYQDPGKGIFYA